MRYFLPVLTAILFLTSTPLLAIEQRTDTSKLYRKTKNRYYKPTPLPKFKLEEPEFDLGDVDETEKRKQRFERSIADHLKEQTVGRGVSESGEEKILTPQEALKEAVRIQKITEAKRRAMDDEMARIEGDYDSVNR